VHAVAEAEAEARKVERLVRRLADLRRADQAPYVGSTTMLNLEAFTNASGPPST
jgi:hypothetical protein